MSGSVFHMPVLPGRAATFDKVADGDFTNLRPSISIGQPAPLAQARCLVGVSARYGQG